MTETTSVPRRRSGGHSSPAGTGRTKPVQAQGFAPASWLFVGISIALIAVLTYYLTLTTRPEISQISPSPNSVQTPGEVQLEAVIDSQRDIEEVSFSVDGETMPANLEDNGNGEWVATYSQVFERGDRDVLFKVVDSSGRSAEHSWTFEAAGDLVPPRVVRAAPPSDRSLEAGENGLILDVTTFADIDDVEVTFDGEEVDAEIEEMDPSSEYTADDGLPIHEWSVSAATELAEGSFDVEATVTDVHGAETTEEWTFEVAADDDDAEARYFPETGYYAAEPFRSFWDENEGEATIGPPVSPPITTNGGTEEQYYRYARLELDDEGDVHLGLVGRETFGEPENPPDRPPGDDARHFDPTGHYIYGSIRDFWEDNGGLPTFGYPLSQEFETDEGYAQYFERALIRVDESGDEAEVELAPLGEQLYREHQLEESENDSNGESDVNGSAND